MNIAELKDAIEDLDDDLEVRVNLFNKATVGVESIDFTTYADDDEEIACIVMEGDDVEEKPTMPTRAFDYPDGATEVAPTEEAAADRNDDPDDENHDTEVVQSIKPNN